MRILGDHWPHGLSRPGRSELLDRAVTGWSGAIGPAVPLAEAVTSLRWAEAAVGMVEQGLLARGRLLHCAEHVEALVLLPAGELIDDLARRRLAQLDEAGGPAHAQRLAETLLGRLETRGGASTAKAKRMPGIPCGRSAAGGASLPAGRAPAGRVAEMIYGHESIASGNWPTAFGPLFAAHIQCIRSRIRPRTNPPGNELHQVASTLAGFGHVTSKPQLNGVTGGCQAITGNAFQ